MSGFRRLLSPSWWLCCQATPCPARGGGEDAPLSEPLACLEEDELLKGGTPEAIGLLWAVLG